MDTTLSIAIPTVVFALMFVVGCELAPEDFRRVRGDVGLVVAASAASLLLLPCIAWLVIAVLDPEPWLAAGMILVAASPGGAISNAYVLLARGNTALSVVLTAVSSLAALVAMPLISAVGFRVVLDREASIDLPVGVTVVQLAALLVVPVLAGVGVRHRWPELVERTSPARSAVALAGVVGLVVLVAGSQWELVVARLADLVVDAVAFTVLAMGVGAGVGLALRRPRADRYTLAFELGSRNLAIVTVVAAQALGRLDVAVFAVAFFVIQAPIALGLAFLHRARRPRSGG